MYPSVFPLRKNNSGNTSISFISSILFSFTFIVILVSFSFQACCFCTFPFRTFQRLYLQRQHRLILLHRTMEVVMSLTMSRRNFQQTGYSLQKVLQACKAKHQKIIMHIVVEILFLFCMQNKIL